MIAASDLIKLTELTINQLGKSKKSNETDLEKEITHAPIVIAAGQELQRTFDVISSEFQQIEGAQDISIEFAAAYKQLAYQCKYASCFMLSSEIGTALYVRAAECLVSVQAYLKSNGSLASKEAQRSTVQKLDEFRHSLSLLQAAFDGVADVEDVSQNGTKKLKLT